MLKMGWVVKNYNFCFLTALNLSKCILDSKAFIFDYQYTLIMKLSTSFENSTSAHGSFKENLRLSIEVLSSLRSDCYGFRLKKKTESLYDKLLTSLFSFRLTLVADGILSTSVHAIFLRFLKIPNLVVHRPMQVSLNIYIFLLISNNLRDQSKRCKNSSHIYVNIQDKF